MRTPQSVVAIAAVMLSSLKAPPYQVREASCPYPPKHVLGKAKKKKNKKKR